MDRDAQWSGCRARSTDLVFSFQRKPEAREPISRQPFHEPQLFGGEPHANLNFDARPAEYIIEVGRSIHKFRVKIQAARSVRRLRVKPRAQWGSTSGPGAYDHHGIADELRDAAGEVKPDEEITLTP